MALSAKEDVEALQALLPADGRYDAHQFLTAVYHCEAVPIPIRMSAANTALKVEKPSLSASLTAQTSADEIRSMTPDQIKAEVAAMLRRSGATVIDGKATHVQPAQLPAAPATPPNASEAASGAQEPALIPDEQKPPEAFLTPDEIAEAKAFGMTLEQYADLKQMSLKRPANPTVP